MDKPSEFIKRIYINEVFKFPAPLFYRLAEFFGKSFHQYAKELQEAEFKLVNDFPTEEFDRLPFAVQEDFTKIGIDRFFAEEYLVRYLGYCFVMTLYSAVVLRLVRIAEITSGKSFQQIKAALTGSAPGAQGEIEQAKCFLESCLGFEVSQCKQWKQIDALRVLRNVIVHSEGYVNDKHGKGQFDQWAENGLVYEQGMEETGPGRQRVVVQLEFCKCLVQLATAFFDDFSQRNQGRIEAFVESKLA